MICLSGFELYFRWVPLVGVTHGMHLFLCSILATYAGVLSSLVNWSPPPPLVLWFLIYDGSVHHSVYVQWFWLIYQQIWPMADQQIEHRKPCSFLTVCFCILNWHHLVFAKSTLCCFRRGWTMWLIANSTCNLHAIICFYGGAKCFDIL